jgi:hypothetical protein
VGTGEALLGPVPAGGGSALAYNRFSGKWPVAERESEGVVVVMTDGTTEPVSSEGPLLHRGTTKEVRSSDECREIG